MNIIIVFYVASGVLQPTLIEVLTYNGACEKTTMLFILPNYIGMSLGVLSNLGSIRKGKIRWGRMITLILVDLCSGILCFTGLVSAGSAIFTVVYSSVTVYTALFSWFFFGRPLHFMQWSGVFFVMLGLVSSSYGSSFGSEDDVGIGIIMIMVGSMFHSLSYIVSESILKSDHAISPEFLGSILGIAGCIVFGTWELAYTLPRFQKLIIDEIAAHNGDDTTIIFTYFTLSVVNCIHSVCLFHTIKNVGSTTTGIFKGVISVLVFIISHFAFCSIQQSQCFTIAKGLSLVVVVIGVLMYSSFQIEPNVAKQGRKDLMSKASTIWFEGNRDGIEALAIKNTSKNHNAHIHLHTHSTNSGHGTNTNSLSNHGGNNTNNTSHVSGGSRPRSPRDHIIPRASGSNSTKFMARQRAITPTLLPLPPPLKETQPLNGGATNSKVGHISYQTENTPLV